MQSPFPFNRRGTDQDAPSRDTTHVPIARAWLLPSALVLLCFALLYAARVPALDAFSVDVAVADRSPEEQAAAFEAGLRKVLLGNSGDKTLLNRDSVRDGLRNAQDLVEQYRYTAPEPGTLISADTPLTPAVRQSGEATLLMRLRFDAARVRALIARSDDTDSADSEPSADPLAIVDSALVWMLIDDGARSILVDETSAAPVVERAREIAGGGGLSLRFPDWSAEQAPPVSIEDLRSGNLQAVQAASQRYAEPVVVLAWLARAGSGWKGEWTRLGSRPEAGIQPTVASLDSASLDAALTQGLAWLNPAVAPAPAAPGRSGVQATEALIWFNGIDDPASYGRVMAFLSSLDSVEYAYPREVDGRSMVVAVLPQSALPMVSAQAALSGWLRRGNVPLEARTSPSGRYADIAFDVLR